MRQERESRVASLHSLPQPKGKRDTQRGGEISTERETAVRRDGNIGCKRNIVLRKRYNAFSEAFERERENSLVGWWILKATRGQQEEQPTFTRTLHLAFPSSPSMSPFSSPPLTRTCRESKEISRRANSSSSLPPPCLHVSVFSPFPFLHLPSSFTSVLPQLDQRSIISTRPSHTHSLSLPM